MDRVTFTPRRPWPLLVGYACLTLVAGVGVFLTVLLILVWLAP